MKNRNVLFLYFFFCIVSIFPAFTQVTVEPVFRNEYIGQDIKNNIFEVKGGYLDPSAFTVYLDREGFFWMGGINWLAKYDGSRYTLYRNRFKDKKGYCGSIINSLYEDREGYLWIGAQGGLSRLDTRTGQITCHILYPGESSTGKNNIRYIYEDKNGRLWILTDGNCLLMDRETSTFCPLFSPDTPLDNSLQQITPGIFEDHAGRIWIPATHGLYMLENGRDTFRVFRHDPADQQSISSDRVVQVVEDSQGTLWCATQDRGLNRIDDPVHGVFTRIYPDVRTEAIERFDSITQILWDGKDRIWAACPFSFFSVQYRTLETDCYEVKDNQFISGQYTSSPYSFNIETMLIGQDQSIWMIDHGRGGLYRFRPQDTDLTRYQSWYWSLTQVLMEPSGVIWAGNFHRFALRYDFSHVPYIEIRINHMTGLGFQDCQLLAECKGQLWIAASSGLHILPVNNMLQEPLNIMESFIKDKGIISCVFKEKENILWFGTENGTLWKYNLLTRNYLAYHLPEIPLIQQDRVIREVLSDSSGNLWISGYKYLCKMNSLTGVIEPVLTSSPPGSDGDELFILDMLVDRENEIWLTTLDDGIIRLDHNGRVIRHYTEVVGDTTCVVDNRAGKIREDRDGILWFIPYSKNPFLFDREKEQFLEAPIRITELNDFQINDLLIDSKNRKWFFTNFGITVASPDLSSSYTIDFPDKVTTPVFFETSTGDIVLLERNRLYIFYENYRINNDIPAVRITGIKINGMDYFSFFPNSVPLSELHRLDLKHHQNQLTIEFTALNYLDPQKNMFKYRMEGIDRDTTTTRDMRYAEYRKLPPGRYRFWVTGSNNDGIWNPEGVSLDIHVHPPFYRAVLAYMIYGIVFLAGILLYVCSRLSRLRKAKENLETLVAERTRQLEEKNLRIEEMGRLKTRFFTDISHEIRTPLSLILGPIDGVIDELRKNKKIQRQLELMRRNGIRLSAMVNQLLDISRLETGHMKIELSQMDVFKFLRTFVQEFISLAETRKIHYTIDIPEGEYVDWCDRGKLEKICANLLSNAFKFTPAGGNIHIKIRVQINAGTGNPTDLILVVMDSGPGIPKEEQERIFDRFYRVEGQWAKDGDGTGIGLSLTRDLVQLLHGKIVLESKPGKGSEFTVSLPMGKKHLTIEEYVLLDVAEDIPYTEKIVGELIEGVPPEHEAHDEKKPLVLVVEDNLDLRVYLKENLEQSYTVVLAEDGAEGLKIAMEQIPDLVITDLMMPGLDGRVLCSALKKDEKTSHIPVIILTARSTMDDKIDGLSLGADDYIIKPFQMQELQARIHNLLEQRKKLREKYSGIIQMDEEQIPVSSVDEKFLKKIIGIISGHMEDFEFDVGTLQELAGMSKMQLLRKVKAIMGIPPSTLIRVMRLKRAAKLIQKKAGNITEIACKVGFYNPSHFAKCFREYHGISPKEYEKNANGEIHRKAGP